MYVYEGDIHVNSTKQVFEKQVISISFVKILLIRLFQHNYITR